MNMVTEYLIVGSGLTGSVIARLLADSGQSVLVIDRRDHIGGNVHDHFHPSGIRIHTYGPHYFRTSSDKIWNFVLRFSEFYEYRASLTSFVDGKYENWPILKNYIQRTIGNSWSPDFKDTPANFEEACLAMMPSIIYEKFVKGYSEKQWGVEPKKLDKSLAGRFDIREDDQPLLKYHKYQGIPVNGYAVLMKNLLKGIPVINNFDYLKNREEIKANKKIIFTGPIDEYFAYCFGKLKYRGQKREHIYYEDKDYILPCGQVNNPDHQTGEHIRTLEWKHLMEPKYANKIKGSVITTETTYTPYSSEEYEYPFPDQENQELFLKYKDLASHDNKLLICGRLGEYKYYDMDQAIGRAMMLAKKLFLEISLSKAGSVVDDTITYLDKISELDFA